MNCLITGITGFLGPHLAIKLIENGHKIYGSSLKEIRHLIDYPRLHNK